jgi:hypothetical protein
MAENYKCPDCGAKIEDRGDGTAEVTVNVGSYLTGDCETCREHQESRMAELARKIAQRRFEKYKGILAGG